MAEEFKGSYSPYGAFELKAKYQRNMLFGTFMTTAFVVVLVGGIWIATAHSGVDVEKGGNKIEPKVVLKQPPRIIKKRPWVNIHKPEVVFPEYYIPVAVPDDELSEDDEIEMKSNNELEIFGTADPDADESIGGDGSESYGADDGEYFPSEGDFVYVEIQPEMIHEVMPEYPRLAKRAGIDGKVKISALVSKEGDVLMANVAVSSGNDSLDNAALAVAKQNKFKPGIQNGRPIAIWVVYTVDFVLSN